MSPPSSTTYPSSIPSLWNIEKVTLTAYLGTAPSSPGALVTTGGIALPGGGSAPTPSGSATVLPGFVALGTPTLPGGSMIGSLLATAGSLAGLVPLPTLVDAVWGMSFTPQTAPQTPFALGNTAGTSTGFTSEKMKGADAVFGSNNVAPVFPVTQSAVLVNYGWNGVSAGTNVPANQAPATVRGGPVILAQVGADANPANAVDPRGMAETIKQQRDREYRDWWSSLSKEQKDLFRYLNSDDQMRLFEATWNRGKIIEINPERAKQMDEFIAKLWKRAEELKAKGVKEAAKQWRDFDEVTKRPPAMPVPPDLPAGITATTQEVANAISATMEAAKLAENVEGGTGKEPVKVCIGNIHAATSPGWIEIPGKGCTLGSLVARLKALQDAGKSVAVIEIYYHAMGQPGQIGLGTRRTIARTPTPRTLSLLITRRR